MKPKRYWVGYVNGKIDSSAEYWSKRACVPLFLKRRDAKAEYEDVRPVEIREIKK